MEQEIEDVAALRLPEALKQLQNGFEAMEKIARYCHNAQKKKEYQQVYMQSQDYSKDALTNAAYHVNTIGAHLTKFLALQAGKVEQLDIHIKILTDRMSGLKASAGFAHYQSEKAEAEVYVGARNSVIASQSLPQSSKIAARHMRKPVTSDIFLEKPIFNPHFFEPTPAPFSVPMSVEDFNNWREESSTGAKPEASTSGAVPPLDVPAAKKKKSKKKDSTGQPSGRKTKRSKADSGATPALNPSSVPPPPPGPAPPPPI